MEHEVDLGMDDIVDIITSCYDMRRRPKQCINAISQDNLRSQKSSSTMSRVGTNIEKNHYGTKVWVATGLLPQFMTVFMKEKWCLRRVSYLIK